MELRRRDEAFLNALGTDKTPDPTTAGDFCRRFAETDIARIVKLVVGEVRYGEGCVEFTHGQVLAW